ncbi:MAG TPA: hypothetical protein VMU48_04470 [Terracidiphilus sp.]|nr:hypothetical protein [Terracidiphilus sp.]
MTEAQQANFENEILRAAFSADRAVSTCRIRLAGIGEHLETLGRALQEHPEEVTRLPESQSIHDYREELNTCDSEKIINLCKELRFLIDKAKSAEKRKEMLISGAFFSRDSGGS